MHTETLIKTLEKLNKVSNALIDVLDSWTWQDIHNMTGLPEERCKEIYEIYKSELEINT